MTPFRIGGLGGHAVLTQKKERPLTKLIAFDRIFNIIIYHL